MLDEPRDELIQMAREALAVDWVTGVCMSFLLYDYLITIDQEVARMWPAPFSIPKVLFFLNRYVVVGMLVFNAIASHLNHLSIPFCVFYLRWLVCTITVTNAVVEGILVTRVWALFRSNQMILYIALALYFSEILTLVGLTITDYVSDPVHVVTDFSVLPGCYAASVPSIIAGYWIAPVIVESFMFIMIVSRAIIWWKDNEPVPPTLRLIARDSALYYSAIFALLMTNLFVFEFASPFLSSMMVTPANTVGCIAGSRMLLNLRGLKDPMQLSTFHTTHSQIEFASAGGKGHPPQTKRGRSLAAILSGISSVGTSTSMGRDPTRATGEGDPELELDAVTSRSDAGAAEERGSQGLDARVATAYAQAGPSGT